MKNSEKYRILERNFPKIAFAYHARFTNPNKWVICASKKHAGHVGHIRTGGTVVTYGLEDIEDLKEVINFRIGLDILMI